MGPVWEGCGISYQEWQADHQALKLPTGAQYDQDHFTKMHPQSKTQNGLKGLRSLRRTRTVRWGADETRGGPPRGPVQPASWSPVRRKAGQGPAPGVSTETPTWCHTSGKGQAGPLPGQFPCTEVLPQCPVHTEVRGVRQNSFPTEL